MSTLKETLQNDATLALKNQDKVKLSIIRYVIGEIDSAERAGKTPVVFTDEQVTAKISNISKKLKENVDLYTQNGETAHAEAAQAELDVLQAYLPTQMSEAEVRTLVQGVLADLGDTANRGVVMKTVMGTAKNQADGKMVAAIVQEEMQK